ncbi:probable alpha,alpha-trehalose-phosphate synthase [UDP-forming] 9 [Nicotiana tomentosiformis]|uniref:probable alpha,alpha-trehalose-phosphate synthase [UDP-forming] 9 n=1 Tax=Nicotiana tomentosiformis TaxID=4098 RepID=UPI00051B745F|nr:probable alpha,alpha-trehalose-phosphate synthase [UDP-forming] 9 [Nicotiana tomentosiformis]XP_009604624.1 probable alpha,alpha-trehalose-phosphate synthase [UDP-forming] 9 [Nicotiana tomentosiformis]XP_009604625.1 probable alpha,alpha-trehalose-phosphate synthase [UDP-forming] 9 [Nicotiana tomentosiformis]XP_018627352.1 probable alpha,alpha-trehalose-phosphate synthase [UDP-forming] 9 [Nicotiana tomentosiformis]XP_033512811.1 probable alpha,alpha-trehalose-phosphate synthase [UDP-forming] 
MASRSCANFFDLASVEILDIPQIPRALPRVMTVPGIIAGGYGSNDGDSDSITSACHERKIIVANMLPLHAQRDTAAEKWCFSLDEDSLLLQLKDGFSPETEVIYVGSLKVDVELSEQEEVTQRLLEEFKCVPTYVPRDIQEKFYHGFCKQQLWPLFHYMLPMCPDHGDRFDRQLWQAYVSANKLFADKVMEVVNPEDDYIWVQDYHLMVLPTFLRKRYHRVKLGFFLHSPFPSSEIYRTLPVRDEILKGLLNCDLIGFHTFDYARHFLSCCSRMLGLDYESKRGHIGLDYFGRTVYIKILPVGIHKGRLELVLNLSSTFAKAKEVQEQFKGMKVILGVDDMDIFKGISLKLLAFEHLLQQHEDLQGKLVLVQIVNPARSSGKDVQEAKRETYLTVDRINQIYGRSNYEPVILIDRPVARYEKTAYYAVADCCIVNAVRDGMNLVPYKYIVCRQGSLGMDEAMGIKADSLRTSMLVVSEFIGCSPSLSGAIRVNPWDIEAVAEALNVAITMSDSEKVLRHEKHYRYVSSHDVAYWARSFMQDLERACKDHYSKRCWGIGLGLGFRVIALSPSFRKLSIDHIVSSYRRTQRRAIFLDYDGTVVPQSSMVKAPSAEVITLLNTLSNDPKNTVYIVSGRGRTSLSEWLAPCERLGIAAEHGYFIRESKTSDWESLASDLEWNEIVEPVMKLYREATDGSYIETKESALVWHHHDADPDFGSCQAKELLDHLESVLANEPAVVKRGQHIVEVKPQGVTKGLVSEKVLSMMVDSGKPPDFVMCIGDDRSDEDMFESILSTVSSLSVTAAPDIFACTVGQKPSKAKYYLDDTADVLRLLGGLANASCPKPRHTAQFQLAFGSII